MTRLAGYGLTLAAFLLASLLASGAVYAEGEGGSPVQHRVAPGETLWEIAEHYYGDADAWVRIGRANDIGVPIHLQPGTLLDIDPVPSFPGIVEHVTGGVWRVAQRGREALCQGDRLRAGESLATDADGFVTLRFGDGARIVLPSNTRVTLRKPEEGQGVSVSLDEGGVESRVPKNPARMQGFDVTTPTGSLGVRGTHFRAAYRDDASTTSVLEGLVDAELGGQQADVGAGRGAWGSAEGGFGVVDLLPAPRVQSPGLGGADGAVDGQDESDSLRLALSEVRGASQYRAQLATDPDFLNVVRDARTSGRCLAFSGLSAGFYHARLTAISDKGVEGLPGHELVFHRPAAAHVEYRGGEWLFRWDPQPGARYRLQLAASEDFSGLLIERGLEDAAGARIASLPEGEYYWRLMVTPAGADSSHIVGLGRLNAAARR